MEKNWINKNIILVLAIMWMVFAMCIYSVSIYKGIDVDDTIDAITLLIIGFFFGSSKGSKDKTEKLTGP